jgi:hypothetical protein
MPCPTCLTAAALAASTRGKWLQALGYAGLNHSSKHQHRLTAFDGCKRHCYYSPQMEVNCSNLLPVEDSNTMGACGGTPSHLSWITAAPTYA